MNNTGIIFRRVLKDSRGSIIGWSIGMALYVIYIVAIYPFLQDIQELNELMQSPVMQAFLGEEVVDFASPAGFLGSYFFLFAPIILAVFAVLFGLGITAAEEDRGTLDVLLSLPVRRSQLILEKFAASIVILLAVLATTIVAFLVGRVISPDLQVAIGDLVMGIINMLPILLFVIALTLLLSTVLRSRGTAGGIVAAVLVISYFLDTLSGMMEAPLSNMRYASLFYYYNGAGVLINGIDWGGFLLLSAGTVVLLGLSLVAFERRDLGT